MKYITDRAEQQVNRLTAHIKENEDFANLVRALGGAKWQVLEDVYNDLFNKRHLGDAGDAQLDVLGKHLITLREGRDDASYTTLLDTRYEFFQRSGEPEKLIALYQIFTGAHLIKYDDTYALQCNNLIAFFLPGDLALLEAVDQIETTATMRVAKQAGQGLRLCLALEPVFRFGSGSSPTLDSDNGFNSGKFVEVIIEF